MGVLEGALSAGGERMKEPLFTAEDVDDVLDRYFQAGGTGFDLSDISNYVEAENEKEEIIIYRLSLLPDYPTSQYYDDLNASVVEKYSEKVGEQPGWEYEVYLVVVRKTSNVVEVYDKTVNVFTFDKDDWEAVVSFIEDEVNARGMGSWDIAIESWIVKQYRVVVQEKFVEVKPKKRKKKKREGKVLIKRGKPAVIFDASAARKTVWDKLSNVYSKIKGALSEIRKRKRGKTMEKFLRGEVRVFIQPSKTMPVKAIIASGAVPVKAMDFYLMRYYVMNKARRYEKITQSEVVKHFYRLWERKYPKTAIRYAVKEIFSQPFLKGDYDRSVMEFMLDMYREGVGVKKAYQMYKNKFGTGMNYNNFRALYHYFLVNPTVFAKSPYSFQAAYKIGRAMVNHTPKYMERKYGIKYRWFVTMLKEVYQKDYSGKWKIRPPKGIVRHLESR